MNLWGRIAALAFVAVLAGLAVHQHNARLRLAYQARRALEEQGEIRNEILWLRTRIDALQTPSAALPRARRLGLVPESPAGGTTVPAREVSADDAGN